MFVRKRKKVFLQGPSLKLREESVNCRSRMITKMACTWLLDPSSVLIIIVMMRMPYLKDDVKF